MCGGAGFRLEPQFPIQLPEQEAAKEACTGLPVPSWTCWIWARGGGGGRRQEQDSPWSLVPRHTLCFVSSVTLEVLRAHSSLLPSPPLSFLLPSLSLPPSPEGFWPAWHCQFVSLGCVCVPSTYSSPCLWLVPHFCPVTSRVLSVGSPLAPFAGERIYQWVFYLGQF